MSTLYNDRPESGMKASEAFMTPKEGLFIFTRYPQPGITKTRLITAIGAEGAALLQRRMTERILEQARQLQKRRAIRPVVAYAGGDISQVRRWLGENLAYMAQGDGTIGDRMHRAFIQANRQGYTKAVIIGTDIPQLTAELIWRAFQSLEHADLVLGPAKDGGYYLIGMGAILVPEPPRALFDDIVWGSAKVLQQTLLAAQRVGYKWILLDELQDVDRPEDLALWRSLTQNG